MLRCAPVWCQGYHGSAQRFIKQLRVWARMHNASCHSLLLGNTFASRNQEHTPKRFLNESESKRSLCRGGRKPRFLEDPPGNPPWMSWGLMTWFPIAQSQILTILLMLLFVKRMPLSCVACRKCSIGMALHCFGMHYFALHCIALFRIASLCNASYCSALLYFASVWYALQCFTMLCIAMWCITSLC